MPKHGQIETGQLDGGPENMKCDNEYINVYLFCARGSQIVKLRLDVSLNKNKNTSFDSVNGALLLTLRSDVRNRKMFHDIKIELDKII